MCWAVFAILVLFSMNFLDFFEIPCGSLKQDHADVEAINKKVAKDSTGQKDVKLLPYKITGNTGKPMIQVTVKGEVSLRTIDN